MDDSMEYWKNIHVYNLSMFNIFGKPSEMNFLIVGLVHD